MFGYIQCSEFIEIRQSNSGLSLYCRYSDDAVALTEEQIIEIYGPPLSIADAHIIGGAFFSLMFAVWLGKQYSNLGRGGERDY